jgi:hypothetical protein
LQQQQQQQQQQQNEQNNRINTFINPVLVISMSIVGFLFLLIGITCGPAFSDIQDGSVTAYLTIKYPNVIWYKVINASVMVAVFCTFPLQLTPAMEVLNEWFGPGCDPKCCTSTTRLRGLLSVRRRRRRRRRGHTQIAQQDADVVQDEPEDEEEVEINSSSCSSSNNNNTNNNARATNPSTIGSGDGDGGGGDGLLVINTATNVVNDDEMTTTARDAINNNNDIITTTTTQSNMNNINNSCFGQYEWIFRRYIVVFCCTIIVLSVNDLSLLMSLFGAVGNTGLAGMPCIIHLRLMKLNIAPFNFILMGIDICTIILSISVAITGVTFTLQEII